MKALRRR